MNFKDNLKKLRKDNNLSQEELAEKLNVTRQSVSKWESGVAYPEMDKVIQICKMFNVNIDDLLNKDINEVNETKESKNNINKYIDDVLGYITKTVNVFSSLKFGGKVKCLFEQLVLIGILVAIFAIIGSVGGHIIYSIFGNLGIYRLVDGLFEGLFIVAAWVISVALLAHIFKVRYLDYYEIVDSKEEKEETKEEKIEIKKQEKIDTPKKEKVIIRDEKHSEYGFIKALLKIIVFFIKFIVFWIAFSFVFVLIGLVIAAVLSFAIVKSGTLFVGTFSMLLSGIFAVIILLSIMYNFIFNKKNKVKTLGVELLLSIILFGIGVGLFTLSIKNFTYINDINDETHYIHEKYKYEMTDDLTIYGKYFDVDYVEEDRQDVKIELVYTKYNKINLTKNNNKIYFEYEDVNPINIINNAIEDINNYEIIVQDNDKIIVHANKENINKLMNNTESIRKEY